MRSLAQNVFLSRLFLPLFVPLSVLYGLAVRLRNLFFDLRIYRTHKLNTPVLSVGNISTGGTGKTILVQSIAENLLAHDIKPAILSRGYGRRTSGLQIVSDGNRIYGDPFSSGDEPYLLSRNLPGVPVVVSEDRVKGAIHIEENYSPEMILLDDGFQHRSLHRDLDIVLLDRSGSTREHLLPWGDLREGIRSLSRADIVLNAKSPIVENDDAEFSLANHKFLTSHDGNMIPIEALENGFGVFAGLGNNTFFFRSIEESIGSPLTAIFLPDHCRYDASDIAKIPLENCPAWVTSQKDIVKLSSELCDRYNIYSLGVSGRLPNALFRELKHYFK